MNYPIVFPKHRSRVITLYEKIDRRIPARLFAQKMEKPDVSGIPYPLPSDPASYTCMARGEDGVIWYGSGDSGVTRYAPNEVREADVIQYFSADRDLPDNKVRALWPDGHNVWVETEDGVAHIEMVEMTMEEKANRLLKETLTAIDRHGMITQRTLTRDNDITSFVPYGHSDNDGGFTAEFAIGEMMHFAVLEREKGAEDPETIEARRVATRAFEAALLLCYISGRGDGFVARTYVTTAEPVPDDGLFYRKNGGKATCLETTSSRRRGLAGKVIDASAPVPDRLAALYRSEGFTDDDIIYKGDTSSDEITMHFMSMYYAQKILAPDDEELNSLIKTAARATMTHILDHHYTLCECDGKPTTWAKWNPEYFESGLGYVDAPLNSAEILMYLKATMVILNEKGRWQEAYEELLALGYADLPAKHFDRFYQACVAAGIDLYEDIMYGDHALATYSFWGLLMFEEDAALRQKYIDGFLTWRTSIGREHNPLSDFIYMIACPGTKIDVDALQEWFLRGNTSMIASSVTVKGRRDMPVHQLRQKKMETDWLLAPDERFISKFDRNFYGYKNMDVGGRRHVESCYLFTTPYWMGRYFGIIAPDTAE